jgi:hypothetical protein
MSSTLVISDTASETPRMGLFLDRAAIPAIKNLNTYDIPGRLIDGRVYVFFGSWDQTSPTYVGYNSSGDVLTFASPPVLLRRYRVPITGGLLSRQYSDFTPQSLQAHRAAEYTKSLTATPLVLKSKPEPPRPTSCKTCRSWSQQHICTKFHIPTAPEIGSNCPSHQPIV